MRGAISAARCGFEIGETGYVAAWSRQAWGEAAADWIGDVDEHNRNRLRLAGKGSRHGRALIEDRIELQIDQLPTS